MPHPPRASARANSNFHPISTVCGAPRARNSTDGMNGPSSRRCSASKLHNRSRSRQPSQVELVKVEPEIRTCTRKCARRSSRPSPQPASQFKAPLTNHGSHRELRRQRFALDADHPSKGLFPRQVTRKSPRRMRDPFSSTIAAVLRSKSEQLPGMRANTRAVRTECRDAGGVKKPKQERAVPLAPAAPQGSRGVPRARPCRLRPCAAAASRSPKAEGQR